MIDVLVADDEAPARGELAHLLRRDDRIGEVVVAASGAEAMAVLSERPIAIAFLDIHMPGASGIDLARAVGGLAVPPAVVFVTADDARAVDAFDLRAVDYLLKPVRVERLRRAVDRALELAGALPASPPGKVGDATGRPARDAPGGAPAHPAPGDPAGATDEVLPVTVGSTVRFVRRSDVQWVQAQGDYSRLHGRSPDAGDGAGAALGHLVRVPISELEARWADAGFVRVHRSTLVHVASVTAARLTGPDPVVTVGGVDLPVSRRLLPAVREALLRGRR